MDNKKQERMKKTMNKKDEKEMGDEHEERIQKTTKKHVMRNMRKTRDVYNHDKQNDSDVVTMNRTMTMSSIMMFMAMLMLELWLSHHNANVFASWTCDVAWAFRAWFRMRQDRSREDQLVIAQVLV